MRFSAILSTPGSPSTLNPQSALLVRLDRLLDNRSGAFVNNAAVTVQALVGTQTTSAGGIVTQSFSVIASGTLTYVAGSKGRYEAWTALPAIPAGTLVTIRASALASKVNGQWDIRRRAESVQASQQPILTRLFTGPYGAITALREVTPTQAAMFSGISAELAFMSPNLPEWSSNPDNPGAAPVAALQAWVNQMLFDPSNPVTYTPLNPSPSTRAFVIDLENAIYARMFSTVPAEAASAAACRQYFIDSINAIKAIVPNGVVGVYTMPAIEVSVGGLAAMVGYATTVAPVIAACTGLFPAFYFNGADRIPGYTDVQYLGAAMDVLLDSNLCQNKPTYIVVWGRNIEFGAPGVGLTLVDRTRMYDAVRYAAGYHRPTPRAHALAGAYLWEPDEPFHNDFISHVEPAYTAFSTEAPYLGGAIPWGGPTGYRETRCEWILKNVHNALRQTNIALPSMT